MAITIDWANKVINVPKADTTLVQTGPPEIRSLDLDTFRKTLNGLQESEEGMPFDTTHFYTAPLTVAGVTLNRVVEIINGYTVQFENLQYSVNIIGGNSNIGDVKVQNQVSVNTANSAGLQLVAAGNVLTQDDIDNLSAGVWGEDLTAYTTEAIAGDTVRRMAYGDGVWVSSIGGSTGTTFPIGTPGKPVSNFTEAQTIANALGLKKIYVRYNGTGYTMPAVHFAGFSFVGAEKQTKLTLADGMNYFYGYYDGLTVTGSTAVNGSFHQRGGVRQALAASEYWAERVQLEGTMSVYTLAGNHYWTFLNCWSDGQTTFTCSGKAVTVEMTGWSGDLLVTNADGANSFNIHLAGGKVTLAATVTAGTYNISGNGEVVDNSTGTANVVDETTVDVGAVRGSTVAATRLATIEQTTAIGTVSDAAFSPTRTQFEASVTSNYADHWKGGVVFWTSTALLGQRTDILSCSDQGGGVTRFTVTEMPAAPVNGATFIIG